ncbi:leucine-rich repeat-containing protein 41 isoform X2 [Chelmon rostratus]|uniref:leucine-rich repeat-containing protein 41 isoform X2 n=1 Tax=Chelmon rostratus TaxID=109905 RepID=UPI001BE96C45|nr:leucine-rich repeat-containing protein 41 isoform X2 [Chelmon rostratus]
MRDTGRKAEQRSPTVVCLKEVCFQAVRKHFAALATEAVLDLPTPLIKDLLRHLTVCQLDELQPALNQRGISTLSGWLGVLQDMCGPKHVIEQHTEEEAKHEVMRMLFTLVFYGFTNPFVKRNITNLNTPSFLWAAAKCIRHFFLSTSLHKRLQGLTAEERPLLNLLEKRIRSVGVSQCIDLSKRKTQTALYVLHRLLDHGVAKELVVHAKCPIVLAWLLHGRGSQYRNPELMNLMHSQKPSCVSPAASASADRASCSPGLETRMSEDQDDEVTPCKRSKLDSVSVEEEESRKANLTVDPQLLCQTFSPCDGPSAVACPWGQIDCLEIRQCGSDSLRVLNSALPTFSCLRSLTLHSISTFRDSDVLDLARALRQLSDSSCSSLTDLCISILPYTKLVVILLDASPNLTSLHVTIQNVMWDPRFSQHRPRTAESDKSELPLEKLTVKVAELQTDLHFITSVLRRSPHLTSFHIAGIRLPTGSSQSRLLATLSESNHFLRSLNLEDMNLSDCLPEILNLLRDCKLEELQFNDCRLLEKWSNKEESLQQLVAALKTVPTLHTLSLAQNRLAKNVCVLAELFSGCSPSSVRRLNISSNFIQPAELLEFTNRLRTHRPPHQLTLDLRKNPGDRDPETWNTAMRGLRPFCVLLFEGWTSTGTMSDHISNM